MGLGLAGFAVGGVEGAVIGSMLDGPSDKEHEQRLQRIRDFHKIQEKTVQSVKQLGFNQEGMRMNRFIQVAGILVAGFVAATACPPLAVAMGVNASGLLATVGFGGAAAAMGVIGTKMVNSDKAELMEEAIAVYKKVEEVGGIDKYLQIFADDIKKLHNEQTNINFEENLKEMYNDGKEFAAQSKKINFTAKKQSVIDEPSKDKKLSI